MIYKIWSDSWFQNQLVKIVHRNFIRSHHQKKMFWLTRTISFELETPFLSLFNSENIRTINFIINNHYTFNFWLRETGQEKQISFPSLPCPVSTDRIHSFRSVSHDVCGLCGHLSRYVRLTPLFHSLPVCVVRLDLPCLLSHSVEDHLGRRCLFGGAYAILSFGGLWPLIDGSVGRRAPGPFFRSGCLPLHWVGNHESHSPWSIRLPNTVTLPVLYTVTLSVLFLFSIPQHSSPCCHFRKGFFFFFL